MNKNKNIEKLTMRDKVLKTLRYYETKDYDKFTYFNSNRKVKFTKSGSVAFRGKLKKSLEKNGWCVYLPLLVMENNGKLWIYDGQHRFELAKELGIPVVYTIVEPEFLPIDFVSKINSTSKPWSPYDYIQSYASGRDDVSGEVTKSYEELLTKVNNYKDFCTLTSIVKICSGKFVRGTASDFKNGDFSYDKIHEDEIEFILDFFKDNHEIIKKNKSRCDCKSKAISVMLDACYKDSKTYNIEKLTKALSKVSTQNSVPKFLGELDILMKMQSKNYKGCLVDYYLSTPIQSKAA